MLRLPSGEHEPHLHASSDVKPGSVHVVHTRLLPPRSASPSAQASALTPSEADSSPIAYDAPAQFEVSPAAPNQGNTPAPPDYWPRKWLNSPPSPVAPTVVPYPATAASEPSEGWVILELFISASGHVDRIETLSSEAPNEFIESARQTFLQSPFSPGMKDNVPVPSRIKIEVRYKQDRHALPRP